MPDLEHTLQGHDLGFLKIVAGGWGIELNAPDAVTALPVLVEGIVENADFAEVIEALPQDAKNVLQSLLQNEGRMLWAMFVRKYGELRRMGMAKRDRERPDLKPASAVEVLWYRGLVGRAFLNLPPSSEPQEYAYIPEDLLPLLPTLRGDAPPPLGRPATPNESAHPLPAGDRILDHACTLLAALRLKLDPNELARLPLGGMPLEALKGLLRSARLLDYDDLPDPERTRAFLEAPRGRALAQLAQGWMSDPHYNELRLLPGLKFEGDWSNDPLRSRQAILELVSQIPQDRWWSLAAFVAAVREQHPDFQRPAGDYDSWFIRQGENGEYLRGFSAWDEVDGALVRFLITGPMHWLGLLDLASSEDAETRKRGDTGTGRRGSGAETAAPVGGDASEASTPAELRSTDAAGAASRARPADSPMTPLNAAGAPVTALRLSAWAEALWHGDAPEGLPAETAPLKAAGDGRVSLAALTPRAVRYQVARFCQWEPEKERAGRPEYRYRITPAALERAKAQGLRAAQFIGLLRRHSDGPLPPMLVQALERWDSAGTQAVVERAILLRVTSPEILAALRKTRAARCLGDALNETTVLVRPEMEEQVLAALAEIGYLAEAKLFDSK